ncbi:ABC transporter transmembrane domain-containing protein [Lacticaseibacillus paracasei]|jgi:ABC-type multidrug transport system fused ATPase/permease subunit|uniref:Putative ABC transporter ATP-binding protein n=4 Tax=Lacticaseibacillus paracasei TaxID=1597 RepID=A0A422MET9_LACPA|nr:ABC transporter ATP-binding protein [Lacticaseibacillus paracasei]MDM7527328.1 ABC transporter ATP-binding protein [Lacticaseibacillus paracasei]RND89723.1 putative ABC transporter ATP-binding protein [Lacticaseibacillus paracasei]
MNPIIIRTLKKHGVAFTLLVIFTIISTALITGNTYLEGRLLDSLVYSHRPTLFITFFVLMLGIGILRLFFSFFTSHIQILTKQETVLELNRKIFFELFKKDTLSILKWSPTTLSSRINDDVTEIVSFFSDTLVKLCSVIVSTITISAYVFSADPKIFIIMIIFIPIYFLIYIVFRPKIYSINLTMKNKQNEYYTTRNDFVGRYIEIKGSGNFSSEKKRLRTVEDGLLKTFVKSFWVRYWMSTSQIVMQLVFQAVFFIVGGLAVLRGNITIGFFSIVLQYFGQLLNSVDQIFGIAIGTEKYHASLTRMKRIFDIAADKNGDRPISSVRAIDINNFNIKMFPESKKDSKMFYSQDLSCSFENPGLYVISGDNGIGKSTFVRTITRIYQPKLRGSVLINGLDVNKIDMDALRQKEMGFLFQDVPSPHITVREYLSDLERNGFLNDLKESRPFLNVYFSDVFNLADIYEKKVDVLSSGELQLVRLLAALGKKDASMYILDEPTANIYPQIRSAVICLLQELGKSKLIITISHDEHLIGLGKSIVME